LGKVYAVSQLLNASGIDIKSQGGIMLAKFYGEGKTHIALSDDSNFGIF
jgi:hypothetical protein